VRVVFDSTYPSVDMGTFIETDWKSMFGDAKEMITSDAPVTRGKEVYLRLFVDSDHDGEQFTRRSRTGFVIYLNMAQHVWFSKRVSSSTFYSRDSASDTILFFPAIWTYFGPHSSRSNIHLVIRSFDSLPLCTITF
jgi:hypothetical protein